jgi:hypothetical protein
MCGNQIKTSNKTTKNFIFRFPNLKSGTISRNIKGTNKTKFPKTLRILKIHQIIGQVGKSRGSGGRLTKFVLIKRYTNIELTFVRLITSDNLLHVVG